jgi:hypothetical protein
MEETTRILLISVSAMFVAHVASGSINRRPFPRAEELLTTAIQTRSAAFA